MAMASPVLSHRPEIDGLRAVAVLPVLLVHAGFRLFSGGYVGVDVFFVISGFLITGILDREVGERRFSFLRFYERRARRILPALFLVLAASIPFAWVLMLPHDLSRFGASLGAVTAFLSNVYFALQNGYFEPENAFKPLVHTWSLGVEEQFYIFYPLLLWALYRLPRRVTLIVLSSLLGLSLALAEFLWRKDGTLNFFIFPTRAWELLAGGLLALAPIDRQALRLRRRRLAQAVSLAGLTAIGAACLLFNADTPTPSLAVAVPVVGTVLVIACAVPGTIAYGILSNPLAVGVGLISYSAYLWHQPLFAFARMYWVAGISAWGFAGLIVLTLALAWMSWRFVESPFRDRRRVGRGAIVGGAAAGMAAFAAIGVGFYETHGAAWRLPASSARVARGADDISPYRDTCGNRMPRDFSHDCVFGSPGSPIVAVVGDSHGKELFWRATTKLAGRPYALQAFLWNACSPFAALESRTADLGCAPFRQRSRAYILENPAIRAVVIVANWPVYLPCDHGGCAADASRRAGQSSNSAQIADNKATAAAMAGELAAYRAAGKAVVLVGSVPEMPWDVPLYMQMRVLRREGVAGIGVERVAHEARTEAVTPFLDQEARQPNVVTLDPADILCGAGRNALCPAQSGGVPLYFDQGHLNGYGADPVAARLVEVLDGLADQWRVRPSGKPPIAEAQPLAADASADAKRPGDRRRASVTDLRSADQRTQWQTL
jgi:peptidoglycan/LPS O-acetylase OafA/YrhL